MDAFGLLQAFGSYLRVRLFPYLNRTPDSVAKWQVKRLSGWIDNHVSKVSAFQSSVHPSTAIDDFLVMDKSILMANFVKYNIAGVSAESGWKAFESTKQIGKFVVGASTGTSGNRGLYVISQQERYRWLGTILAKAVPDCWRQKNRVAVMLPVDTPLYDTANKANRLQVKFFDISNPLESFMGDLENFTPTILIAPPRMLRRLVEMKLELSPKHVFSAAEKLETFDKDAIEAGFNAPLGEIYMATEGLLAVSCKHGRLHLSEDCMHFELEDAGGGLVTPIISDFSRTTQIMLRYKLNDLLRMDAAPCPCGSPLRVVSEVIGRMDDIFRLKGSGESVVELMPDVIRNTIIDCDRSIDDFRIIQTDRNSMTLKLDKSCPFEIGEIVLEQLQKLFARYGCNPDILLEFADLTELTDRKLRRVENRVR